MHHHPKPWTHRIFRSRERNQSTWYAVWLILKSLKCMAKTRSLSGRNLFIISVNSWIQYPGPKGELGALCSQENLTFRKTIFCWKVERRPWIWSFTKSLMRYCSLCPRKFLFANVLLSHVLWKIYEITLSELFKFIKCFYKNTDNRVEINKIYAWWFKKRDIWINVK